MTHQVYPGAEWPAASRGRLRPPSAALEGRPQQQLQQQHRPHQPPSWHCLAPVLLALPLLLRAKRLCAQPLQPLPLPLPPRVSEVVLSRHHHLLGWQLPWRWRQLPAQWRACQIRHRPLHHQQELLLNWGHLWQLRCLLRLALCSSSLSGGLQLLPLHHLQGAPPLLLLLLLHWAGCCGGWVVVVAS